MVRFSMRGMSPSIISVNRGANRPSQRTTDNGTIAPANLITNCRACSTTDTATNCRIQGGTVRVRFNSRQCQYQNQVTYIHGCMLCGKWMSICHYRYRHKTLCERGLNIRNFCANL